MESVRGNLDMMILAVLANAPAHGYAQIEALRSRSGGLFDIAEGTLYPALHKLEAARVVRSRWEQVNGRKRRVYSITASGQRALAERHSQWAAVRDAIDAVMGGPSWATTT